jgi:hypothetical protein
MSILEIKRAAERHLATMPNQWPVAYESVSFTPPNANYLKVQFAIQPPDDPTLGVGYHRERIQLQVFVVTDSGSGTGQAITKAEELRSRFTKGTFLLEAGIRIHVLNTPSIRSAVSLNERVVVPVLIDLVCEVQT